jgi:N-acyl-D-aspartate/D-glutamate deacylase
VDAKTDMTTMKRMRLTTGLAVAALALATAAAAQDVAITNARIIVGSGQVIDSGTIVVRGGRIVSVTAGAAATTGLRVIDAKGMSAMPGFIDSHKHVSNGENAAGQARLLLEAGASTRASSSARASFRPARSICVKHPPRRGRRSRRWRRRGLSTRARSR